MLLEVELFSYVCPEEVTNLLVVDLEVRGTNEELHVLRRLNYLENVLERPGRNQKFYRTCAQ